jgi:predicted kinase
MRVPKLVLFFGSCGAGKTYVSRRLAAKQGWLRYSSDEERARLFPGATFDEVQNELLWSSLGSSITRDIGAGRSVVVDAAMNRRAYRRRVVDLCFVAGHAFDVRCVFVEATSEVAWSRLATRPPDMSPYRVDRATFERIASHVEMDPSESLFVFSNHTAVSADFEIEMRRLKAWLDEVVGPGGHSPDGSRSA